jgi:hypothetical protein
VRDFLLKLSICAALIAGVVALGSALPSSIANLRLPQIASFG